MTNKVYFGIKLDKDINDKLVKIAELTGVRRSEMVRRALLTFLREERDPIFAAYSRAIRDQIHKQVDSI